MRASSLWAGITMSRRMAKSPAPQSGRRWSDVCACRGTGRLGDRQARRNRRGSVAALRHEYQLLRTSNGNCDEAHSGPPSVSRRGPPADRRPLLGDDDVDAEHHAAGEGEGGQGAQDDVGRGHSAAVGSAMIGGAGGAEDEGREGDRDHHARQRAGPHELEELAPVDGGGRHASAVRTWPRATRRPKKASTTPRIESETTTGPSAPEPKMELTP